MLFPRCADHDYLRRFHGLSIPTDGGFWIVSRMSNLDTKQTLTCVSVPSTLSCIVLFVLAMILNSFTGILPGL